MVGTIYVPFNGTRTEAMAFAEEKGEGRVKAPRHPGLSKYREGQLLSVSFKNGDQMVSGRELLERLGFARELHDVCDSQKMDSAERARRGLKGWSAAEKRAYEKQQERDRITRRYSREPQATVSTHPSYAAVQLRMLKIAANAFMEQARQIADEPHAEMTVSVTAMGATFVFTSANAKLPPVDESAA